MKKFIISALAVTLAIGLVGAGAFAWFSDVETSTGNTFITGTLDIDTSFSSPVITMDNMKPGDYKDLEFSYTNAGSLDGYASFILSYVEADGTPPVGFEFPANMSADDVAKMLIVTGAQVDDGTGYRDEQLNWLEWVGVWDGNPYDPSPESMSIYDMAAVPFWPDVDFEPISPNESHTVKCRVTFDPNAGNDYQFDRVDVTLTINLDQIAPWEP